jgi:hypothetical protein
MNGVGTTEKATETVTVRKFADYWPHDEQWYPSLPRPVILPPAKPLCSKELEIERAEHAEFLEWLRKASQRKDILLMDQNGKRIRLSELLSRPPNPVSLESLVNENMKMLERAMSTLGHERRRSLRKSQAAKFTELSSNFQDFAKHYSGVIDVVVSYTPVVQNLRTVRMLTRERRRKPRINSSVAPRMGHCQFSSLYITPPVPLS